MVTLRDVAEAANVSTMTVSRVINHPSKVRDDLKVSVFQVMKELGYRPNFAAKALAKNATQIIKLVVLEDMDTTEPYYANFLIGAASELEAHHYALQLAQRHSIDIGGCDGFIVTGMREKDFEWLDKLKVPVVLFGQNSHNYPSVDIDNHAAVERSTEYALKCHYEHVVFIGIDLSEPFEKHREQGYQTVMKKNGLTVELYQISNHSHVATDFINEYWNRWLPNTCFVCSSDRIAFGIQRGLQAHGNVVPERFGVIGFDGIFLNAIATPKITTIHQSLKKMGAESVKMLLSKITHPDESARDVIFSPSLVVAGSTRGEVD